MAEMRKNIIKEKLSNGQKALTLMGVANPDQVDQLGPLDFDGIWLETDKGWWVLRASNTQPAIVARCEAKSLKGLESIVNQLIKDLEEQGIDVSNSFNSS